MIAKSIVLIIGIVAGLSVAAYALVRLGIKGIKKVISLAKSI